MNQENSGELKGRRSSILKTNGASNEEDGISRRVSFAKKMKVKTFDEGGCNESHMVPRPDDTDMSIVNSTPNESVSMEIETPHTNGTADTATLEPAVAISPTKIPFDSTNDEDSGEDEELTGDLLKRFSKGVPQQVVSSESSDDDSENSELTGDVLKRMSTMNCFGKILQKTPADDDEDNDLGNFSDDIDLPEWFVHWEAEEEKWNRRVAENTASCKRINSLVDEMVAKVQEYEEFVKNVQVYPYQAKKK